MTQAGPVAQTRILRSKLSPNPVDKPVGDRVAAIA